MTLNFLLSEFSALDATAKSLSHNQFIKSVFRYVAFALVVVTFSISCAKPNNVSAAEAVPAGDPQLIDLVDLRVNGRVQPLGIDDLSPIFSWRMAAQMDVWYQYQTHYRVTVSDEAKQLVWDSGKVESGESHALNYDGEALIPMQRYNWFVPVPCPIDFK